MSGPLPSSAEALERRRSNRAGGRREAENRTARTEPVGDPPAILSEIGREEWRRVAEILERRGYLGREDRGALLAYCEAFAELVAAVEAIRESGRVWISRTKSTVTAKASPWLAIRDRAAGRVLRFGRVLGIQPSARVSVVPKDGGGGQAGQGGPDDLDRWDQKWSPEVLPGGAASA